MSGAAPLDAWLLRFLLASAGCLAAGLGVWALTALCRRLPGVALQRSTWLLGQATVVAAFLVILLPHSERLRLCLLYTSPSPRDGLLSRMPSSA